MHQAARAADDDLPIANPYMLSAYLEREDRYKAPDRPSTPDDHAKTRRLLEQVLPYLGMEDWRVRLDLGDSDILLVEARQGEAMIRDDDGGTVDCTLTCPPRTISEIIQREMLPRFAISGQMIAVAGDKRLATRFCDALIGRRVANRLITDSPLPSPTTDWALAKRQLDEFGYAIVKNVLSPDQIVRVRGRLMDQAQAERERGIACMEGGEIDSPLQPNQRVWNLINKGQQFLDLLEHPIIDAFVPDHLGDYALLSNHTANITGPGSKHQFPHSDQGQFPVDFAIGLNIFWFVGDVTEANGGTRVLPGSHRPDIGMADLFSVEETIAIEAPAGSALLFDTRLWHGAGANKTESEKRPVIISVFNRYWARQTDNIALSASDAVLDRVSPRVKSMFGLRITTSRGTVEGQAIGCEGKIVGRDLDRVEMLRSSGPAEDR